MLDANAISKKYNKDWIFKDLSLSCPSGHSLGIIGPNGSGKSTLLKVLTGHILPNQGSITTLVKGVEIAPDHFYKYLTLATPYQEIPEALTLTEYLNFHFKFKKLRTFKSLAALVEFAYLNGHENKAIQHFSSGMKQRLKLASALFSDVPFVFLDEPSTNLDQKAIEWYFSALAEIKDKTTVIIASNIEKEVALCNNVINIGDFKGG